MGCSSLNSDLYRNNIVTSPSCVCGDFESTYHFFFRCPSYITIRNTYLSQYLLTRVTKDLLVGKQNASVTENETMCLEVQEFIIEPKRFV